MGVVEYQRSVSYLHCCSVRIKVGRTRVRIALRKAQHRPRSDYVNGGHFAVDCSFEIGGELFVKVDLQHSVGHRTVAP